MPSESPADTAVLERALQEARKDNAQLQGENERLRQEIKLLTLKVQQLLHRIYGRRSEKRDPRQLTFLSQKVEAPEEPAPDDEATHETPPQRRRKPRRRPQLPKDLPRERIVHELSEAERRCPCCGEPMEPFAEDVTEELDYIPAQLLVREHVRPKYRCRACQEGVRQAPMPPRPIEKGLAGPGLLAHVLVSKYVDHLPLYRQSRIFERLGIELSRSTLCDWVAVCAEELDPIVAELKRRVLASGAVQADETPIVVLEDHNLRRRRQGWLWLYRGQQEVVFDYRPTRARDGPRIFLQDYAGYLQTDGYQAYSGLSPEIVQVGCWAHARRKFVQAHDFAPEESARAVEWIGQLYAIERRARELSPEERAALRQVEAPPILERLASALERWSGQALPQSPLGQAVAYARSQWSRLVRYLENGRLQIDNNAAERALRGVSLGRKNWLFAGSEAGARRAATIYSLVESCRAVGVEPYAYLRDVLTRTATATARELTPAAWKRAREQTSA